MPIYYGQFIPFDLHSGIVCYQRSVQTAHLDEKSRTLKLVGSKIVIGNCQRVFCAQFLRLNDEAENLVLIFYKTNNRVYKMSLYKWPSLAAEVAQMTYQDADHSNVYLNAIPNQVDTYLYLMCLSKSSVRFLKKNIYYLG